MSIRMAAAVQRLVTLGSRDPPRRRPASAPTQSNWQGELPWRRCRVRPCVRLLPQRTVKFLVGDASRASPAEDLALACGVRPRMGRCRFEWQRRFSVWSRSARVTHPGGDLRRRRLNRIGKVSCRGGVASGGPACSAAGPLRRNGPTVSRNRPDFRWVGPSGRGWPFLDLRLHTTPRAGYIDVESVGVCLIVHVERRVGAAGHVAGTRTSRQIHGTRLKAERVGRCRSRKSENGS